MDGNAANQEPHWRDRIRADLAKQAANGAVLYGNDADGNECRFHPDGRTEIVRPSSEVQAEDEAIFGDDNA